MTAVADIDGALEWQGGGARPLPLGDSVSVWRVEAGYADVFVLRAGGGRRHLFRLETGALLIGGGGARALIAVGSLDSRLIQVPVAALDRALAVDWIERMTESASPGVRVWPDGILGPGRAALQAGKRHAPGGGGVLWITPSSETLSWFGEIALAPDVPTPVVSPGWARADIDVEVEVQCEPPIGEALLASIRRLNGMATRLFADREQQETREMAGRGLERRLRADLALEHGLNLLAGRAPPRSGVGRDGLSFALAEVCAAIGHEAALPKPAQEGPNQLDRTMAAGKLLGRPVVLSPGWWRRDGLPLLTRMRDEQWVALLPQAKGGWRAVGIDRSLAVTAEVAEQISSEATQIYPGLPARSLRLRDLGGLASRGLGRDLLRVGVMGTAAGVIALAVPIASGLLFDHVIPSGDMGGLWQILVGLIALAIGQTSFEVVKATALMRMEARLDSNLQAAVFDRLLRLPVGFFRQFTAGDLSQRALGLQQAREVVSGAALTGLLSALFGLVNLSVLFAIDARLALLAIGLTAVIAGVSAGVSFGQLRYERRREAAKGRTEGFLLQLLVGVGKLRAAGAEKRALAQWALRSAEHRKAFLGVQRFTALQTIIQSALPNAALLLVFLAVAMLAKADLHQAALNALVASGGGAGDAAAKTLSIGSFAAFTAAFGQLTAAITSAALASTELLGVAPLLERTRPILETVPEVSPERVDPGRLAGRIDFRRVTFRYTPSGPAVLDGLSFSIKAGEFVAIVGASGSGKTTVLRMLLGFEQAEAGQIFYDEIATDRLEPSALRGQIGAVLQNGRITAGSIFDNIIGEGQGGLDDAWAAARLVALADDIEAMPMGMHTVLPDGGGTLSGGQRQRVLIARAMARRPAILLLDEATSALDNRTQATVTETLADLDVTRIVIAHRLSTIREVDRILVLEHGQLVEEGGYDDLIERGGRFAELAQRQIL
jgi:NHLM bacteriocin system ABC transporter ATP-binding protein